MFNPRIEPIKHIFKMYKCQNRNEKIDKFQRAIKEIFLSGSLWRVYRIYKKIIHSDEGDFKMLVKSGVPWRWGRYHMYASIKIKVIA